MDWASAHFHKDLGGWLNASAAAFFPSIASEGQVGDNNPTLVEVNVLDLSRDHFWQCGTV
jgi:hypothetical protein